MGDGGMAAARERMKGKQNRFRFIKPSDLMRIIHYRENSMGETVPMIQLSPTKSLPWYVGIKGTIIQEEILVGKQPNYISHH